MVNSCFFPNRKPAKHDSTWFFVLITWLFLSVPIKGWTAASSEVSATSITSEDFITLQVTLEGEFSDDIDTSALENDFDIDNQSLSRNHSAINGRVRRFTQWTFSLLPKRTGLLTIPEFQFGTAKTQEIVVQVSAGRTPTTNSPIQLSAEIETTSPYVQQPVIINLKLLYRGQIGNAKFQFPDTNGAILDNLADPTSSQVRIGKYNYTQWEQKLILIPQTPGTLELDPISFRADLVTNAFRRRPMIRRTAPLVFDVRGIPSSYPSNKPWLPAKKLDLSDTLASNTALTANEPFTRTVTIKATGNIAGAIPTLENSPHPQFKQYAEPVTENTQFENNELIGSKSLSVALIPLSGTQATLPETSVYWWNTDTNTLEVTSIKPKTVAIDGLENSNIATSAPASASTLPTDAAPQPTNPSSRLTQESRIWWKEPATLIAAGAITLWLLTVLVWAISRKPHRTKQPPGTQYHARRAGAAPEDVKATLESAKRAVKEACTEANSKATAESLIKWFNLAFSEQPVHSVSALIPLAENSTLRQALKNLETHLYRDSDASWDAKTVARHFTELKPKQENEFVLSNLEPLYLDEKG